MFRKQYTSLLAAALASALLLTGCSAPQKEDGSASSAPDASASQSAQDSSAQQEPEPPAEAPTPEPAPAPQPPAVSSSDAPWDGEPFDYSEPAPENGTVEKEYFDNAAFIGDSRTDGFLIYSGIGRGKNLTSNGLSIFKLGTKKALKLDGREYTLLEALHLEQYDKVYLSLGINELGFYDDDGFYKSYCDAIDAIQEAQPNAVIYIQGLIPLNEKRVAEELHRDYLRNDHLRVYNDLMKKAAREKGVIFLDLYSAFADASGSLPYDASRDGVHLNSEYCKRWLTYLQTHAVNRQAVGLPAA